MPNYLLHETVCLISVYLSVSKSNHVTKDRRSKKIKKEHSQGLPFLLLPPYAAMIEKASERVCGKLIPRTEN
jgi:hypothetical protein